MRCLFLFFFVFTFNNLPAQIPKDATDFFSISGKVKTEKTISLADLKQYPAIDLENINTSCSPKTEKRVKSLKAVLLRNILDSVSYAGGKGELNQYYFLFTASDGYKIVFSYNEIFNTETGNNLYIVKEMEGKEIEQMDNRILVLLTKDIKSGTRNMKWLSKIVVCKAE